MKRINTLSSYGALLGLVFVPHLVHAADLITLAGRVATIVGIMTPVVVGLALVVFFWGLVKFIYSAGSDQGREEGKQRMIWGIVALFVIVSIWGIVGFIGGELGIGEKTSQPAPTITFP